MAIVISVKLRSEDRGDAAFRRAAESLKSARAHATALNSSLGMTPAKIAATNRALDGMVSRLQTAKALSRGIASNLGSAGAGAASAVRTSGPRGGGPPTGGGAPRSILPFTGASSSQATGAKPPVLPNAFDVFQLRHRVARSFGTAGSAQHKAAYASAIQYAQGLMASGSVRGYRMMGTLAGAYSSVNPKPRQSPLMSAIMSSRIGFGNGGTQFAPLVGRSLAAMGPGGASMAAAGSAAMIAVHGLKMLGDVSVETARALRDVAYTRSAIGSSASFAGAMSGAGGAEAAAMALQQSIQSGAGAGFAGRIGINPIGGPFGDNDYGRKLREAMTAIANASSFDEARRMAEAFGMPSAAQSYFLRPDQKARLGGGGGVSNAAMASGVQANADMEAAMIEWQKLKNEALVPMTKAFGDVVSGATDIAKGFGGVREGVSMFIDALSFLSPIIGGLRALGQKTRQEESARAIAENTKALKENTRVMDERRTNYGGGSRAQNAVPRGMTGLSMNPEGMASIGSGVAI